MSQSDSDQGVPDPKLDLDGVLKFGRTMLSELLMYALGGFSAGISAALFLLNQLNWLGQVYGPYAAGAMYVTFVIAVALWFFAVRAQDRHQKQFDDRKTLYIKQQIAEGVEAKEAAAKASAKTFLTTLDTHVRIVLEVLGFERYATGALSLRYKLIFVSPIPVKHSVRFRDGRLYVDELHGHSPLLFTCLPTCDRDFDPASGASVETLEDTAVQDNVNIRLATVVKAKALRASVQFDYVLKTDFGEFRGSVINRTVFELGSGFVTQDSMSTVET